MTTLQLNAQIQQSLDLIKDDAGMLQRVANYLKRITKKKDDPTLMSKEEFFANVDEALEQAEQGKVITFSSKEEMNNWLNNL